MGMCSCIENRIIRVVRVNIEHVNARTTRTSRFSIVFLPINNRALRLVENRFIRVFVRNAVYVLARLTRSSRLRNLRNLRANKKPRKLRRYLNKSTKNRTHRTFFYSLRPTAKRWNAYASSNPSLSTRLFTAGLSVFMRSKFSSGVSTGFISSAAQDE